MPSLPTTKGGSPPHEPSIITGHPPGSGVGAQGPDHLTFDLADASKMSLSFYGKRPGPELLRALAGWDWAGVAGAAATGAPALAFEWHSRHSDTGKATLPWQTPHF